MTIQAVPKVYRGTRFRSTLEADWAATFDHYGWAWQYEPVAVKLPDGGRYRPDFYLPGQRVWAEVKGPHNERIKKPADLQRAVYVEGEAWSWSSDLVVILRPPGPGEMANWEGALPEQDIVIVRCPDCQHYSFMDHNGLWSCRRHISEAGRWRTEKAKFWIQPGGALYWPGELQFIRSDDPRRAA